jgi:hemin uptake protein HemP
MSSIQPEKIQRNACAKDRLQKPVFDSIALLGSGDEVLIRHGAEIYRLRRTRQGKLILTK